MNDRTQHLSRTLVVLVFAVLALGFVPGMAYAAYNTEGVSYTVTMLKYEPVPASPGDVIDAYIQITNNGRMSGKSLLLRVETSYPFAPASSTDAMNSIGAIASSSSLVQRVRVAIDGRAQDGVYNLPVAVSEDGTTWSSTELPVQVRSTSTVLAVTSASTSSSDIIPGMPFNFSVVVHNGQAGLVRDVSLAIDLDGSSFSPVGMTTKQTIGRIEGNGDAVYHFTLIADPKAASGVYRLPMAFTFTTAEGTLITQSETAGIVIHAQPEVSVIVDKVNVLTDGKEGTIVLRIVNKGLSQIKFTQVTVQDGSGYTVADSSRTAYIGNIDSDDFQTNEFTLTPSGKSLTLNVLVTYRDALNQEYSKNYALAVTPKAPASSGSFTSPIAIIIIAIVVIGGIVWWRRRTNAGKKR